MTRQYIKMIETKVKQPKARSRGLNYVAFPWQTFPSRICTYLQVGDTAYMHKISTLL